MQCYNHDDQNAVGLCKACGKGLCHDCAADLGHGLACKGVHEDKVTSLNQITTKSAEIYNAAPKNALIAPLFVLAMGAIFIGSGFYYGIGRSTLSTTMGVLFAVYGLVMLVRNRALYGKDRS
ncbi:hypothetical protein [Profundibacter amoris]|uniref:B box-type domain-containing protein n=1 Tax=Profundibacter amoris TaxID=2171755 RepID=A0A347UIT6_9RHOB|nr:hypothetical protein [Profundibacter amoris]AXX98764.1 hypothetical protein BAR1_13030 [Profundibacter amoris]